MLRQADEIPIAPSVGIHMPPRHSLAEELGLGLDGKNHVEGDYDDIDLRIQGSNMTRLPDHCAAFYDAEIPFS